MKKDSFLNYNYKSGGAGAVRAGVEFEKKIIDSLLLSAKAEDYIIDDVNFQKYVGKAKTQFLHGIKSHSGSLLALIGNQGTLLKYFNREFKSEIAILKYKKIQDIWSKDLAPDLFIFDLKNKNIHILEMKYQKSSGSVDEKIQTGPFKKLMWSKLFKSYGFNITFSYFLSSHFSKPHTWKNRVDSYKDVKDYLRKNEIFVYVDPIKENVISFSNYLNKAPFMPLASSK